MPKKNLSERNGIIKESSLKPFFATLSVRDEVMLSSKASQPLGNDPLIA